MQKKINTDKAPGALGPYSQAVEIDQLVYTSGQLGIDPAPVFMGVVLMVFVAMLTPSASPHAAMMHGNKELYTQKDIMSIGIPVCVFTWLAYSFIGYPLIKVLLSVLG